MDEHPGDAMHRYDAARADLADVDRAVQQIDLRAHTKGHGAPLSAGEISAACELLDRQSDAGAAFGAAAAALCAALRAE